MRFAADGPDIPGDLLDARDDGEVVLFCGAGVSMARAGGPSFYTLAERVADGLGSARTSAAHQLIDFSGRITPPLGVGGVPPADRVFALLEQEFTVADVRAAVAGAVRPRPDADLDPHRWLLDLGLAPDGGRRLVTTNFDLLFEAADATVVPMAHPFLPNPRRAAAFTGVVHLHGMVTPDYAGAGPGGFVLSSADFGQDYLSDGWATAFMRSLLYRFKVVFVGYSADDPPIQYLLEALNRAAPSNRLYAFHLGQAEQAATIWRHKGVTAIPFAGYDQLWRSIELWAGWSMRDHMRTELTTAALMMAAQRQRPPAGLICHSDRGSQHAAEACRKQLAGMEAVPSMSRTACCYDNAPMESFFHTLKVELVHQRRWATRDEARRDLIAYIEGYDNRQRIHSAIGYITPEQAERKAS